MRIVLTGAAGFLGWHTRTRLHALTDHEVVPVTRETWDQLPALLAGADAVIHVAGVNRGDPDEVQAGNVQLADDLAYALRQDGAPVRVVYANSIQAGNGTPYGTGKEQAATLLAEATYLRRRTLRRRPPAQHLRRTRPAGIQLVRRDLRRRGGARRAAPDQPTARWACCTCRVPPSRSSTPS